jgi:hypothetical protein
MVPERPYGTGRGTVKLSTGPLPAYREIVRRDPGYDGPGPLRTADFRAMLAMVPFAVVFVIGAIVGMGLIIAQWGKP